MSAPCDKPLELVRVPCPRCNFAESAPLFSGRDCLYRLPGEFHVSECRCCGLWFQNPRPPTEALAALYPSNYGPHAPLNSPHRPSPKIDEMSSSCSRLKDRPSGTGVVAMIRWLRRGMGQVKLGLSRTITFICGSSRSHLSKRLGYPVDSADSSTRSSLRLFDALYRWKCGVELVPKFVSDGRLLEIGCGSGSRLLNLRELGWRGLLGIELVSVAAERACASGFEVQCGPVEEVLEKYADGSLDVVVSSMVLEHLCNPFEVISRIAAKLRPGGQLLFSTVIRDSLDGRFFGQHGVSYDFRRHMVYFRKQDLLDMLKEQFDCLECFHQHSPIDFVRPARWRLDDGNGGLLDRLILVLAKTPMLSWFCLLQAWAGASGRVSFRCRRKL
jgi:SAM-dependent methyltransferase